MTREEAISGLKEIRDWAGLPYCIEEPLGKEGVAVITTEMIDMAIKALEQKSKYRKEAKRWKNKALEQETVSKESYDHEYFLRKELEMKVAKLEQQITKQQPCEDAVSRKEVLEMIEQIQDAGGFIGYSTYSEAFDRVDNMSPVTPTNVLEDIKAEVEQYSLLTRERVIGIIDKHISGKE